jgi:hypothetical protein
VLRKVGIWIDGVRVDEAVIDVDIDLPEGAELVWEGTTLPGCELDDRGDRDRSRQLGALHRARRLLGRTGRVVSVERLTLVLVYARALRRSYVLHADLTRPTQYERDCRFAAEQAKS